MKRQRYHLDTLSNGLRVLRVPAEVGSVFSLVLANTGSRYEVPAVQGIAHFFEHMAFKGTHKYPTAKDIAMTIDGLGADFNAFTGNEYTGYYIKTASQHAPIAWEMLAEMLLRPVLSPEEIERERGVILEEMRMYIDSPQAHIGNIFSNLLYQDSGLGHNIVGNQQTIEKINENDFKEFLQTWYSLGNLLLVVAGDKELVDDADCLAKITSYFSIAPDIKRQSPLAREQFLEQKFTYGPHLHLETRETEQAHFVLGWPGLAINDDRKYAATLLQVILGGNMSSRLFTQVREKLGLCYYVGTWSDRNLDSGCLGARAGVNLAKIEPALLATIAEFKKLATGKELIDEAEFARAREFVSGQTILSLESVDNVAERMGMGYMLRGVIETPQQQLTALQKVTKKQVEQLAQQMFKTGELRLAIIGPYSDTKPFEQILSTY